MSNQLSLRCVSIGLVVVGGVAVHPCAALAQGQMDLPGVTVTAASPVKRRPATSGAAAEGGQGQGEGQPQLPTTP